MNAVERCRRESRTMDVAEEDRSASCSGSNLLELDMTHCPLCHRQLDRDSHVLPCLHAVCHDCLGSLSGSLSGSSGTGELECPECRALWRVNISDPLPPLPTIMQLAKLQVREGKTRVRPTMTTLNKVKNTCTKQPLAVALYNFVAQAEGDLHLKQGDIVYLLKKLNADWFFGRHGNQWGMFPVSYVKVIVPLPDFSSSTPLARALYDLDDDDDQILLHFTRGDLIFVVAAQNDEWGEGTIDEQHGIFPYNYVELNAAAVHLLKRTSSTVGDLPASDTPSQTPSLATPTMTTGPFVEMEPCTEMLQVPHGPRPQSLPTGNEAHPAMYSSPTPIDTHVAVHSYRPEGPDELGLHKGEHYAILSVGHDGWCYGYHIRSSQRGMFPGNFVKLLRQHPEVPPIPLQREESSLEGSRVRSNSSPVEPSSSTQPKRISVGKFLRRIIGRWSVSSTPSANLPPSYLETAMAQMQQARTYGCPHHPLEPTYVESIVHQLEPPPPYSPPLAQDNPRTTVHTFASGPSSQATQPSSIESLRVRGRRIYRVNMPYTPRQPAELELIAGDLISITKPPLVAGGWCKGVNHRSGLSGYLPFSHVADSGVHGVGETTLAAACRHTC